MPAGAAGAAAGNRAVAASAVVASVVVTSSFMRVPPVSYGRCFPYGPKLSARTVCQHCDLLKQGYGRGLAADHPDRRQPRRNRSGGAVRARN
ncbi:hypothetical protein GCM10010329_15710 [Streptomyces spiroverticillatus]|uniref:Uncharacterized protein n=1 Tax=Streptomyces finlayi TaxID=67296 RepID=A0A919CCP2_9ACTN|nr:hypothetical protein GCM10010329_15710 [Streptomyces spiroverticillatus]GHD07315.1 hypothetical protein GCM10010334_59740 [Streptomyces finlayi]